MERRPSTRPSRAARSNRSFGANHQPHPGTAGSPGRPETDPPPRPPRGWYLPDVASKRRELDSFDIVEGLVIKDGPQVEVLNGVSLHGGLVVSWPMVATVTAEMTVSRR